MTLYEWLLAIYPREFRRRFAAGMRAAWSQDYASARRRGRGAALVFVAVTVLHTLWFGLAQRLPRVASVRTFLESDVRAAARSLLATPIVTGVAVLSLALGIGANTAVFSILNSLVIRQLPVPEPERLVIVGRTDWTNPIWEQLRDRQSQLFESAGAWSTQRFNLADSGPVDLVAGAYVSGGLLRTLGAATIVGRPIAPSDDVRGGGPEGYVAAISHRFWQQRFAGDPHIVGRRLSVNRVPFTIVGVTAPRFLGPEVGEAMDVMLPLVAEAAIRGPESRLDERAAWWLQVIARLRAEQSIDAAAAAIEAVRPAVREATVPLNWNAEYRAGFLVKGDFSLVPAATGASPLRQRFEAPLTIILVVVAAVLLIACANIASLMLARAAARRHEMSVRLALGASRARLAGRLIVESGLLALVGGVAGLAVARLGAALLVRQLGVAAGAVTLDVPIDGHVLGFTAAISLGATILFGLAPAFGVGGVTPHDVLKEQSRTVTGGGRFGLRSVLVIAQVALSLVLVTGAGLFVRTFATLASTPLGFDPAPLLIVKVEAGADRTSADLGALAQRLAGVAAGVAGVTRASASSLTPLSGLNWTHRVQVLDGPVLARPEQTVFVNSVEPGWFETYGMRLRAGRDLAASDTSGSERVVVVNEAFVRRFVGARNPLGQRLKGLGLGLLRESVIVGVVSDAVYRTARVGVVPSIYLPIAQEGPPPPAFSMTAQVTGDRRLVERGLTEALGRADASLTFSFRDYRDQVRDTLVQERLVAMLSGFFGALAMLLAALGLYGVTAYTVGRRRPEIALRMALGASRGSVVRLVLGQVAALLVVGTAIGVGLSVWAARFVGALLFGLDARDPVTFAGAAVVLAAIGVFAGWLPARQASRLDPTIALRD